MANGLQAGFQQGALTPGTETIVALTGHAMYMSFGKSTNIQLTGIALQGQQGSFVKSNSITLVGRESSGIKGTFAFAGEANSQELVGQQAQIQQGTLSPQITSLLSGNELSGIKGNLQAESGEAVGLVGIQSNIEEGNFSTLAVDKSLTGRGLQGTQGSFGKSVSFSLTGIGAQALLGNFIVGNKTQVLSWTPSIDTGVTGYFIYWDTQPRGNNNYQLYTYQADVSGRLTSTYTVTGLLPATTYYFNISSHGSGGHDNFESGLLGEISATTSSGSYEIPLSGLQSSLQKGNISSIEISTTLPGREVTAIRGNLGTAGDNNAALSGIQSNLQEGQFILDVDDELIGKEVTSSSGTLGVEYPYTLTGQVLVGQRGTFTKEVEVTLTGAQAGMFGGQLSINSDTIVALTGVQSGFEVGNFTLNNAPTLIGRSATLRSGIFNAYINGTKVYPNTTITDEDLVLIVDALLQDPRTLTLAKFLCLK